jgi:mRNA interferase HigB
VISLKPLREFWEGGGVPGSERFLRAWFKAVEKATWRDHAELKQTFPSADKVGDCYVFDVWTDHIRLVAFVRFADEERGGIVFVRRVMTHKEYDRKKWPEQCGCYKPRPAKRGKKK